MLKKELKIHQPLAHLETKKQKINVFDRLTCLPRNTSKQEHETKSKNKSKHKTESILHDDIKGKISVFKSIEKQQTKLRKKQKQSQLKKIHSDSKININIQSQHSLNQPNTAKSFHNINTIQGWGISKKNLPPTSEQIQVYMKSYDDTNLLKIEGERSFLSSNRETSLVLINQNPQSQKSIQKLKKPIKKTNQLKLKWIGQKVQGTSQQIKRDENKIQVSLQNVIENNRTHHSLKIVKQIDVVICAVNINPVVQENKLNSEIDMYKSKCKGLQTELGETLQKVKEMQNKLIQSQVIGKHQTTSDSPINPNTKPLSSTYFVQQKIEKPLPIPFQSEQSTQQTNKILYSNLINPNDHRSEEKTNTYAKVYSTNSSYSNPLVSNIQVLSLSTTTPTIPQLPVSTPSRQIKQLNAFTSGPSRIVLGPGSPKIIRIGVNRDHCVKGCSSYCTCLINSS